MHDSVHVCDAETGCFGLIFPINSVEVKYKECHFQYQDCYRSKEL